LSLMRSCTARTVEGPRVQMMRRISSSASVGGGEVISQVLLRHLSYVNDDDRTIGSGWLSEVAMSSAASGGIRQKSLTAVLVGHLFEKSERSAGVRLDVAGIRFDDDSYGIHARVQVVEE